MEVKLRTLVIETNDQNRKTHDIEQLGILEFGNVVLRCHTLADVPHG